MHLGLIKIKLKHLFHTNWPLKYSTFWLCTCLPKDEKQQGKTKAQLISFEIVTWISRNLPLGTEFITGHPILHVELNWVNSL